MAHTTTPTPAAQIERGRRLFADRNRYHSQTLDRIFDAAAPVGRHPACQITTREPVEDELDDSIVRGVD